MQPPGLAVVEAARASGTWNALDDVEDLREPSDLAGALDAQPAARAHWDAFPRSTRRGILEWILTAKTDATRLRRIEQTRRRALTAVKRDPGGALPPEPASEWNASRDANRARGTGHPIVPRLGGSATAVIDREPLAPAPSLGRGPAAYLSDLNGAPSARRRSCTRPTRTAPHRPHPPCHFLALVPEPPLVAVTA
ncbi:YdeI/OmpD-associated family protein [Vallicoccus soli]|uniref:YdeI/OmpD-associated family protein n=1 Tax=Vallicoccus soli TaxID=2339232 RepID=UPI00319E252E